MKNLCHPLLILSLLGWRIIDEWAKSYLMTRASKFKPELLISLASYRYQLKERYLNLLVVFYLNKIFSIHNLNIRNPN